ncbi:hypothetical protein [Homoserinibacter sp. GY 40078]|uniref:hypothetical protein n=1 Tax=Homoserinibacter sp. GY 40078 TaxID=2603275 RepID=UPI0011C7BD7B|nr:hypothetical protein [Homoserinibacter sp. GY 40078]TXK18765.1 hypothetical protein FVQ89_02145 [Homoserinibacter sp. GY 40078]
MWGKVTFVFAWIVVGLFLLAMGASTESAAVVVLPYVNLWIFTLVGVRVFRGRGEAIAPPRAWWRTAATARASLIFGSVLGLLALILVVGLVAQPSDFSTLSTVLALSYLVPVAALFIHAGLRLRAAPPPPITADLNRRHSRTVFR